jgi:glycosyltransferase involved in cell wall biosynthesis
MLDLTIVIPAKNESINLPGCLASIGRDFAREVVLVDSGSTDDTRAIAAAGGARVIDFAWNGRFPKKRNWFLRTHPPTTTWVLFLDADEYLTPAFKEEVTAALSRADGNVGYWLHYTIYFMGRPLKGGYPLQKLALFKVGAGEYERIDEDRWSHLDMEIHEHPVLSGPTGVIKSKIDHRDFRDLHHYMAKHNEYASWEAARYLKAVGDPVISGSWTLKQRLKYRLMRSVLIGPVYFLGSFFAMGGFRDGARGFAFALLKMSYFTQIYCRIGEAATGTGKTPRP